MLPSAAASQRMRARSGRRAPCSTVFQVGTHPALPGSATGDLPQCEDRAVIQYSDLLFRRHANIATPASIHRSAPRITAAVPRRERWTFECEIRPRTDGRSEAGTTK
jgi:hypothetical protein